MKNQFKILCGAVALVVAGQVSADTTWTLASNYGTISSGVTVSAYSNTGGNNNYDNYQNNGALQTIQGATWNNVWGGIANADAGTSTYADHNEGNYPEHSIDNNERYDMALLSFNSSVKLTSVTLGWHDQDSDMTVMAYTGTDPFTVSGKLTGKTYDQLIGLGWERVGNYSDVVYHDPNNPNNNGGTATTGATVYSSYWLIGAYNPLAAGTNEGWSLGNDNIKLASVTGLVKPPSDQQVPEPGSMALFGVALLGLFGLRKYQKS